jgi:hypothetical protein
MMNLQSHKLRSLLASILLPYSFCVFSNVENKDQSVPNACSSRDVSQEQCVQFIRGDLDALLQLNKVGYNSNFSGFEQNAFNTRVGKTYLTDVIKKELNLCLPKDVNANEMMAGIDKELPLQDALLSALKVRYPC